MKLFLMLALSLVSMTTGQQPPPTAEDFMGLDDGPDENDLDLALMEKHSGEAAGYLKLLNENYRSVETSSKDDVPAELQEALQAGLDLFDSSSATNELTSLAGTEKEIPPYHCPHNTNQLKWFPLESRNTVTGFCFVPSIYRPVTFATCSKSTCSTNSRKTGGCRPSCYIRRNLRVCCSTVDNPKSWFWTTIKRNLPQACRCGTCCDLPVSSVASVQ